MPENKQFYIKIDGEPIAVTEEIYRAYKRPAWTERKRREVRAEHELSLDVIGGDIADPKPLLEETVLNGISLTDALNALSDSEKSLIETLFFEGLTEREYAAITGISQKNVNKRKQRILMKLKKYFSK